MRGPKALRTLHLRSLIWGDYQREDEDFFREHGDDREFLEAVTKYVFDGEAWPSTLPRGFKREVGEVHGDALMVHRYNKFLHSEHEQNVLDVQRPTLPPGYVEVHLDRTDPRESSTLRALVESWITMLD